MASRDPQNLMSGLGGTYVVNSTAEVTKVIISIEERDQCSIEWVKECPEIDYVPIEVNLF